MEADLSDVYGKRQSELWRQFDCLVLNDVSDASTRAELHAKDDVWYDDTGADEAVDVGMIQLPKLMSRHTTNNNQQRQGLSHSFHLRKEQPAGDVDRARHGLMPLSDGLKSAM